MAWEADLLQRFRDGVPEALAEVFRRYAEVLGRMLRAQSSRRQSFSKLRSASELENLLLETFARAFEPRARQAYDGIRPYEHYLQGIARNVLLEQSRDRETAHGLQPVGAENLPDAEENAPARLVEDYELEMLLTRFQSRLSQEEVLLYRLRFNEGLAQETAAARMGLTRIQLRRRELAVKKRLLEYLHEHGYLTELTAEAWAFVRTKGEA